MERYTIDSLSELNREYVLENGKIRQQDVDMVNRYVELIENTRSDTEPRAGDILRYTDAYGEYYHHAHIEYVTAGIANVCENASVHISKCDESLHGFRLASSGGCWVNLPISRMKHSGSEQKRFWDFGNESYRMMGLDFYVNVNVWTCDMNQERFSTLTHDKYYLSCLKDGRDGYHFFAANDKHGEKAWRTEEEVQAWIRTYRGVITRISGNQAVVWTYQEQYCHVTPEQYEVLEGSEDILQLNGLRYCKRIYDDRSAKLYTNIVWYWEDPAIEDPIERAVLQNKIIKKYEVDKGRGYKENWYARQELRQGFVEHTDLCALYRG